MTFDYSTHLCRLIIIQPNRLYSHTNDRLFHISVGISNIKMYILVFALLLIFNTVHGEFVKVRNGLLRGTLSKSKTGLIYKQFYGIPYAEPPVGKLRFQPPVESKHWNGIKDATEIPPMCVQPQKFNVINSPTIGQEDCLYLNVFAPNIFVKGLGKVPVIVFIHGGAFQSGDGASNKPDYFMDRNIVFVTMNYRLGPFGFLGMNNDYITGNFGLKDQALALKWIKENIEAFGGDPDNITLMGESAGAAAVHLHMFSPLSKGLFQKAIMQSGSAYSPWSYYDESYTEAVATTFALVTGCYNKDPAKVLKCLQKVPAEALSQAESRLYVWDADPTVLFKATIESNVTDSPFLPNKPSEQTYQTKDIPWLTGMNSGEGAFKAFRYLANGGSLVKIIDRDRQRLLPILNQYLYTTEPENIDETTRKIIDYYFHDGNIGLDTDLKLVEMLTDSLFTYPLVRSLLSNHATRYVYYYDHRESYSSQTQLRNHNKDLGVCHGDEMPLLFYNAELEAHWTPSDNKVSITLLNYWINFATYTDPNGQFKEKIWKPVETSGIEYLHIKSDSFVMEKDFLKERYNFWHSLPIGRKNA